LGLQRYELLLPHQTLFKRKMKNIVKRKSYALNGYIVKKPVPEATKKVAVKM